MAKEFARQKVVERITLSAKWLEDSRSEAEAENEVVVLKNFCEEVLRNGLCLEQ